MSLSPDRLERFARHIVLPEIGGAGQARLEAARVVLVGVGGIGSPALQYLAGAGVGRLTLVDDGLVEPSNLQRQTIFGADQIGHRKAAVAAIWAHEFDTGLDVRGRCRRVTDEDAAALVTGADLVLDGCDNFATRLAVSDACTAARVPLLSAAVGRFQGQVGAFAGHLAHSPCYRCYVGDAFDADDCDSCAEDGVLGAMAGWVGTFAVMQAIRVLLAAPDASAGSRAEAGWGDPQWGLLHLLDGLKPGIRTLTIAKDPACRACG